MNYRILKKKLDLPADFAPPAQLIHDDLVATAITRADLEDDVQGINASIDLIRRTRGGRWPTGPVTPVFNFVDLIWHELEFREGFLHVRLARRSGWIPGVLLPVPNGRRAPN